MSEVNSPRFVLNSQYHKILLTICVVLGLPISMMGSVHATESGIFIESVIFSEAGNELRTLTTIDQEVYKPDDGEPLDIEIQGQWYRDRKVSEPLLAIVLPTIQQYPLSIDTNEGTDFNGTLRLDDLPFEKPIQILIFSGDISSSYDPQVISFTLKTDTSYPQLTNLFWETSRSSAVLILLFFLFLGAFLAVVATYRGQTPITRFFTVNLVLILLVLLSYQASSQAILQLARSGLIVVPAATLTIQKKFPDQTPTLTLTRLNENLEVVPALSSSWSNISPRIWEFTLRKDSPITPETITESINKKLNGDEKAYLSSIESIVSVNRDRLQFITKFPDPLLAQKMTKVDLRTDGESTAEGNITDEYVVRADFPGGSRSIRNPEYAGLPFISETPLFQREVIAGNIEDLKKRISEQNIDIFDEPDPILWPMLSEYGYQLQPKISTKSTVLMMNRKNPIFGSSALIAALKKALSYPAILRSESIELGIPANQFAPPGVLGYDPKIEIPVEQRSLTELVEQAKKDLGVENITLKISFPEQENVFAEILLAELDRVGIQMIPTNEAPDLTLVTLDFNLGDIGPFLDGLIDSNSPENHFYKNAEVDSLIAESRSELNSFKRLKLLQKIMRVIVVDDPAGIPLFFERRSFIAKKQPAELGWYEEWVKEIVQQ